MSQVLDYIRLEDRSGDSVEVLLVDRDGTYHVAAVERAISFRMRLLSSTPDLAAAEEALDLAVENFVRGTDLQYGVGDLTIVDESVGTQAQKTLRLLEHPTWGLPGWEGPDTSIDAVEMDFHRKLARQIKEWKGSGDALRVQHHRYWPRFREQVAEAVADRHGDAVTLYRGFYGDEARDVIQSGSLPVRRFSSWTADPDEARAFLRSHRPPHEPLWVIARQRFAPEQIVFAPVQLPAYVDPDMLGPFRWETEYVVENEPGRIPVDIWAKTRSKLLAASYRGRRYVALTPEQKRLRQDYKAEQLRRERTQVPTGADLFAIFDDVGEDWVMHGEWARDEAKRLIALDAHTPNPAAVERRAKQLWVQWADEEIPGLLRRLTRLDGERVERILHLPPNVDPAQHVRLGVYWTVPGAGHDVTTYERPGQNLHKMVYAARVDLAAVDKWLTLLDNLLYGLDKEAEVSFVKGAPIFVYDVELPDGTVIEINDWRRA